MRSLITLEPEIEEGLLIKIAETREELEGAFRVLHDSYVEQGYCSPQPGGLRVMLHHALPTTSVLIARKGERVVGTLTLVRDNRLGLPMEREWKLSRLRINNQRVAEVTCFAIDPQFRRRNRRNVFFPLLRLMYEYATSHFGCRHLAVVVHPKERDFYEGILLFSPLESKLVPDYLGAPAIALFLDLEEAPQSYARTYGGKPDRNNLHRFFLGPRPGAVIIPHRASHSINDPVLDGGSLNYFLFEKSRTGRGATQEQIRQLLWHYPGKEGSRPACRTEVELPAQLLDSEGQVLAEFRIKDVSQSGLRLALGAGILRFGRSTEVQFLVGQAPATFKVIVTPVWVSAAHGMGFRVRPGQAAWRRLVGDLESRLPTFLEVGEVFRKSA